MNEKQLRNPSLDFIRSIAIFLVVNIHALNKVYSFTLKGMRTLSPQSFTLAAFGRALGLEGVPLFFMLTGYLLLPRTFETAHDVMTFWKKKLLPLFLCFEAWILIGEIYIISDSGFSVTGYLRRALMLETYQTMGHMWYMPTIIGIYIFLPFMSMIVRRFSPKLMILPLSVAVFYLFLVPTANLFFEANDLIQLNVKIDIAFVGAYKGIYVLFGYLVKAYIEPALLKKENKTKTCIILALSALAGLLTHFAVVWLSFKNGYVYSMQYNNIFPPLFACPFFILIVILGSSIPFAGLWKRISQNALGIYFVHYICMLLFLDRWESLLDHFKKPVATVLFTLFLLAISFVLVELITKLLPPVGRLLFLKKSTKKTAETKIFP